MNASVQFEVVVCLESLLTGLTFKPSPSSVRWEVAPEVPFTWKNLENKKSSSHTSDLNRIKMSISALVCILPFDSVDRGSCVRQSADVVPGPPG